MNKPRQTPGTFFDVQSADSGIPDDPVRRPRGGGESEESAFLAQFGRQTHQRNLRVFWKPLLLAGFLTITGSILVIVALVELELSAASGLALLILGCLLLLPGAYHARIAFKALRGTEGFSLSDIPEV
ncbi:unnamed protein product [Pedinophyceae sp. YPF-701]|nr:unnamed protein product [Pedinophyceae sp. YPF-701]